MFLNNHNNLSWSPIYQILSLPVERDKELVTWLMERIAPELLTPSHVLQFLNSTSLQVSSLSDSPQTTVSTPQGVPDWYVQQVTHLAAGIPYQACYGGYTCWPLSERPNVPYSTNVWLIQTFYSFASEMNLPCAHSDYFVLFLRTAPRPPRPLPAESRGRRKWRLIVKALSCKLQFPPSHWHDLWLSCYTDMEDSQGSWQPRNLGLGLEHLQSPCLLSCGLPSIPSDTPLLSLISRLPVVLHFSETPTRVLTHVLPLTGYVLTHLL